MLVNGEFWFDNGRYKSMGIIGSSVTLAGLATYILKPDGQFLINSVLGDVRVAIELNELVKHVNISFDLSNLEVTFRLSTVGRAFLSEELFDLSTVENSYHWHAEWHPDHLYFEEGSLPTTFGLIMDDPEVFAG